MEQHGTDGDHPRKAVALLAALGAGLLLVIVGSVAVAATSGNESSDSGRSETEQSTVESPVDCNGENRTNVGSSESGGWDVCDEVGLPAEHLRAGLPEWRVRAKNTSDKVFPDGDVVLANLRNARGEVVASVSCYTPAADIAPGETADFVCAPLDPEHGLDGTEWSAPKHTHITLAPMHS